MMKRYKITRAYVVEAGSEATALYALEQPGAEQYLSYSSIKELPQEHAGWRATLTEQLIGD